jgi:6-phospho-3-hexuloisomerase
MTKMLSVVIEEIETVLKKVKAKELETAVHEISAAPRIFVYGEGRSGLMAKAFAMRLMHAGFIVFAVGETTTPSIQSEDLLVIISGSGNTKSGQFYVESARRTGARILLLTTDPESAIGRLSDRCLQVPAATKYRRSNEPKTIQPLGNLFDQAVHIVLDVVVMKSIEQRDEISADTLHDSMAKRHANLE